MTGEDEPRGGTRNTLSGLELGPVLQGRDFRDVNITNVQAAAAPVALAQLPASVAGFTGREAELAQVTGLLNPMTEPGPVVVSAVAGLAGVGKTALAIQAAHVAQTAGWFGGGVLFMDLHGYDEQAVEPRQALDALLRALGIPAEYIPPLTEERAALYRSALAAITDPVLVVADNASTEAQVRPLLPGAGPHRMLVTSRHTLASLGARLLDIQVMNEQAAITLLDQMLRMARPSDGRITDDSGVARQLARACGGLPLALQITAALLTADLTLSPAELASRLVNERTRLTALHYDDGGGTSEPSVAAAFDLSYRHLDRAAAHLFCLLVVNPGPDVSTEAAAALVDQTVDETRTILGRLARAHLIEPAGTGTSRWRMHDLVRLYARLLNAKQAQAEEPHQARDRLLNYYLNRARAADAHLRSLPDTPIAERFANRIDALAWLDAERPNLIAAAVMAASCGQDQVALLLPLHLTEYLDLRQRFDDGLTVLAISRDTARRLGDRPSEAVALKDLGYALLDLGRYEEAITTLDGALAILHETGDRNPEGRAWNNLGIALVEVQRFERALTALHTAIAIFRETGDRTSEGVTLTTLGAALQVVRRFNEAITTLRQALVVLRETSDRNREGVALNCLGGALQEVRQFDEAITAHQDSAAIFRQTGDRLREGAALNSLGVALQEVRQFDEAITAHQDSAAIFRQTGDRLREGIALNNLGLALSEVGRLGEATIAHQIAAAIDRETGDERTRNSLLRNLKDDRARKGS